MADLDDGSGVSFADNTGALISRTVDPAALQTTTAIGQIVNNFSKFIVTPLNAFGLGGFVFDVEGDTDISLKAEITDHWVENNTVIQDHIGIRPERIVLRNYVGELVDRTDSSTNTVLQQVVQKLTVVSDYLPLVAVQAAQVYDQLSSTDTLANLDNLSVSDLTNEATSLWELTKNLNPGASRQQQAYLYFKALFQQQMLVSMQTPFEFISNLAIESIEAHQSENSKDISEFSITLKQLRFASSQTASFTPTDLQTRASDQAAPVVNSGQTAGTDTGLSTADGVNLDVLKPGQYIPADPPSNPGNG